MADYIHHDPDRVLYGLSEEELDNVANSSQPLWKDVCLVSLSIGIPTLINAIAITKIGDDFSVTLSLFLNYLFGVVGIILGLIFGIAWHRTRKSCKLIIDKIKSRPRTELTPTTSDVGELEELKKK